MNIPLANYETPKQLFGSLVEPSSKQRILLIKGESGLGKTVFINHCLNNLTTKNSVPIQLRGNAVTISEVFFRFGVVLGWVVFPKFTKAVTNLSENANVKVDKNWLLGINNQISISLMSNSESEREDRRAYLSDSFFSDIEAMREPIVVAFDTYEHANAEVSEWIDGPFLARVAFGNILRVVVAGRKIPDQNNIEWRNQSLFYEMLGISEPNHWLPILETLNCRIEGYNEIAWLAGVCQALKGKPYEIMQLIQSLPRR